MKTERAIELLKRLQDEQFDGVHGDERRKALEMAVRALEQNLGQKTIDCIIERLDGEDTAQPTQTNADSTQSNALDCVSRQQAAIDALTELRKKTVASDSGIFIAVWNKMWDKTIHWFETVEGKSLHKVTAWMPLPEPCREGEQDGRDN